MAVSKVDKTLLTSWSLYVMQERVERGVTIRREKGIEQCYNFR